MIIKWHDFKKMQARIYKIIAVIALIFLILAVIEYFYFKGRAPLGTFIGKRYVGGKTYEEIDTILEEISESLERERICLYLLEEEKFFYYSLIDMGIVLERERIIKEINNLNRPFNYFHKLQTYRNGVIIPGLFTVKKERFENALAAIKKERCYPPENAEVKAEGGVLKYRPHKNGKGLKEEKLFAEILQRLYYWPSFPQPFQLETEMIYPARKVSDIINMGIKDKIVSFSTFFDDSLPGRNYNISLAAKALDNLLLGPGEMFSFNDLVGEASLENGYKEAPIIVNEQIEMGPGGGICQVSSTIYNAALLSGLAVVERHNHSLPVAYLPPGFDATISYNYLDLKFINDLTFYILIHMQVLENELRAIFFGDPNKCPEVELITGDFNKIPPPVHYRELSDKPPSYREVLQKGREGYTVETMRIFLKNGMEISRESLGRDYYAPLPEICAVGILSDE